ncbi:MAG: hypothetical protein ACLPWD_03460 [Methanobacterium sp.]
MITKKDSETIKEYRARYYKNYFRIPENRRLNIERKKKRYWIKKILSSNICLSTPKELLPYKNSDELKEIYRISFKEIKEIEE